MSLDSTAPEGVTPRCRKVKQPDRLTAEAVRIGLEIWERATRVGAPRSRFVVFRCRRCMRLHVGRRHADDLGGGPRRPMVPRPCREGEATAEPA